MIGDRVDNRPAYASDLWEMYERLNRLSEAVVQMQSVAIDTNALLFDLRQALVDLCRANVAIDEQATRAEQVRMNNEIISRLLRSE